MHVHAYIRAYMHVYRPVNKGGVMKPGAQSLGPGAWGPNSGHGARAQDQGVGHGVRGQGPGAWGPGPEAWEGSLDFVTTQEPLVFDRRHDQH